MLLLSEFENKTTKYCLNETGLAFNSQQLSGKHANKMTVTATCFFGNIGIISPFKKRTKLCCKPNLKYSEARHLLAVMQFWGVGDCFLPLAFPSW